MLFRSTSPSTPGLESLDSTNAVGFLNAALNASAIIAASVPVIGPSSSFFSLSLIPLARIGSWLPFALRVSETLRRRRMRPMQK